MYPMLVVVAILSISAFIFSDYMLPKANLKYYSLLYDARQQKSANFLPEGVFSNSFPHASIRVNRKDADGQTLHDIMIYTKNLQDNNTDVLLAKEGMMYRTPNGQFLVLKLKDGVRYIETAAPASFNNRQRLTRYRFKSSEQKFDISGLSTLHRTDEGEFKSAYQMMNLKQLKDNEKLTRKQLDSGNKATFKLIASYIKYFAIPQKSTAVKKYLPGEGNPLAGIKQNEQLSTLQNASNEARSIQNVMTNRADRDKELFKNIRRAILEYQKKFTLSAACIALFLIGAPLGAIIRKGGLGLPVVVSVIFFLIYYIISTIGEKSAKDGDLSPVIGSWVAIFIITPIGIFLSYKAATDSVLFDADVYKRFFTRILKREQS